MTYWLNKLERPAYYLDLYRVWPRMVLVGCGAMTWQVTGWYMALKEPSVAQATFVSVVYGAIPLILNFYMGNGVDWDKKRQPSVTTQQPMTATATVTTEKS